MDFYGDDLRHINIRSIFPVSHLLQCFFPCAVYLKLSSIIRHIFHQVAFTFHNGPRFHLPCRSGVFGHIIQSSS